MSGSAIIIFYIHTATSEILDNGFVHFSNLYLHPLIFWNFNFILLSFIWN